MENNSKAQHPVIRIPQEIQRNVDRQVLCPLNRKQSYGLLDPMGEFPATLWLFRFQFDRLK